jgi:type IV secretion system protein VirB11
MKMNEHLIRDYKQDVLELFKVQYKKLSAKNLNLEFKDVLDLTLSELGILTSKNEDIEYLRNWFHFIHEQKFINDLNLNPLMNEIIFHSHSDVQIHYGNHREDLKIHSLSQDDYQLSFEILALRNNIAWNYSEPFASFKVQIAGLEFRMTLIHYSTSSNRLTKVFLRAMKTELPSLELFSLEQNEVQLIKALIGEKKNILVSGSTGSGKTTFLRALLKETDPHEHVIILEDTHEILPTSHNQTSFLSQIDLNKKSLKDYCAYALRMSPDRMIVGEMRSNEVVPFMLAMNTGHRGLMSTIHANSCSDAISRIALLFSLYSENKELDFSLITKLACKNIDYVIHMENKKINQIARIFGSEQENPLYEIVFSRG